MIEAFVRQSNLIEGITRDPTETELRATVRFLANPLTTLNLEELVDDYEPGARLRDKRGMNVLVGSHRPPAGGPSIREDLEILLAEIVAREVRPWAAHCDYEILHPFIDGNGRSGRVLWLWHMKHEDDLNPDYPLSFLQAFYYQTLQQAGER